MSDVFLSYRRDDSRSATGRLADGLQTAFGRDQVFRDLDAIPPGEDFEAALARAIGGARVMLAVIGPRWTELRGADGRRRIDDPADVVRREIEAALEARLPVIPILDEGARMPDAAILPPSLAPFARHQAVVLHDTRWQDDVATLVRDLRQRHGLAVAQGEMPLASRSGVAVFEGLELLVRPRRVLLRLAGAAGRPGLVRAGLHLLMLLALGNLLIGLPMELGLGLIGWVLHGTVICTIAAAFLTALLVASWRLTGVSLAWPGLAGGAMGLIGGGWLYLSLGLMGFALGLAITEPGVFTTLLSRWRQGDPDALSHATGALRGAALGGFIVANVAWIAGLAWAFVAWNALRIAVGARHWQSLLAAILAGGSLVGLAGAVAWAVG
jgi:hypothetical protein